MGMFILGIYTEDFIKGIKYRVYDIVIDKEGKVRLRNYKDMSNILTKDTLYPTVLETDWKDVGRHLDEEYYQSDFGKNIYLYTEGSIRDNILYRPLELNEGDILIRYVLKDDIESGVYNALRNKGGKLEEVVLSDDDLILLSGIGLEEVVGDISTYLSKLKEIVG